METYVALLRAVNVAGKNLIKMEALRDCLEASGLCSVKTYLQSGNLVFQAGAQFSSRSLVDHIKKIILKKFGFSVSVIIRSPQELAKLIKEQASFGTGKSQSSLYFTFLAERPSKEGVQKLHEVPAKKDLFLLRGKEIFIYCANGYGRTKLTNSVIEKCLGEVATTRNWKTVRQLYEMTL